MLRRPAASSSRQLRRDAYRVAALVRQPVPRWRGSRIAAKLRRDESDGGMIAVDSHPVPRHLGRGLLASPSAALFMCVFTSQAGVLVLSPILVDLARDFDVSTAVAGQLRIVAAPVAALVAIAVVRAGARLPYRLLLAGGAAFVAVGSVASAVAPSFQMLALAQVPLWVGISTLVAGGIGAAGAWSAPEERARLVARSLAGAPAAWIIGLPTIGWVAETDWRLAVPAAPPPPGPATVGFPAGPPRPGAAPQAPPSPPRPPPAPP